MPSATDLFDSEVPSPAPAVALSQVEVLLVVTKVEVEWNVAAAARDIRRSIWWLYSGSQEPHIE